MGKLQMFPPGMMQQGPGFGEFMPGFGGLPGCCDNNLPPIDLVF